MTQNWNLQFFEHEISLKILTGTARNVRNYNYLSNLVSGSFGRFHPPTSRIEWLVPQRKQLKGSSDLRQKWQRRESLHAYGTASNCQLMGFGLRLAWHFLRIIYLVIRTLLGVDHILKGTCTISWVCITNLYCSANLLWIQLVNKVMLYVGGGHFIILFYVQVFVKLNTASWYKISRLENQREPLEYMVLELRGSSHTFSKRNLTL